MILVTIVVIIVVAVVAYIMVNRAANGGGGNNNNNAGTNTNSNASNQKRSLLQRSVLDDLQMNTARAVEISADVAASLQPSRRRLKKRFVVDWQLTDPTTTGSDD
jgi:syntaxin 1B/2/3